MPSIGEMLGIDDDDCGPGSGTPGSADESERFEKWLAGLDKKIKDGADMKEMYFRFRAEGRR